MFSFRRLTLAPFIKAHPARQVSPAPAALIAAYEGLLPASLLELWRKKGLGLYGERQLALIDPTPWQPVLDRWIVSPPDSVPRIPIAITPFGVLVYYRKLTADDEDVSFLDPVSKATGDLSWKLDDFFNQFLCDPDSCDSLMPPALLESAREECGPLAPGEVYEIDQMLLSMQMLRISKVDALDLHKRLRDAVDPPKPRADEPGTIADALPDTQRHLFEDMVDSTDIHGLYLSSYIDWHRMLALRPDGQYQLLFWKIDHRSFERTDVRAYSGSYELSHNASGDELVTLDIVLTARSSGSDANDSQLIAVQTDDPRLLLRIDELPDMKTSIEGSNTLGRSEYYFRKVSLDETFAEEDYDGRQAPPFADLPRALQTLLEAAPVVVRITQVDEPNVDEEDDGEGTVMCTLDHGELDGLRMNMPLRSPRDTGRALRGWVWDMAPHACRAGIKYRRGADGQIEQGPMVGDVLTSQMRRD